jgi:putative membrane protein
MALAVLLAPEQDRSKLLLWAAVTYVVTFALEALGVHTGLVFGGYRYGGTLGLGLLGVPLVIGFNWVLVVAAAVALTERLGTSPVLEAMAAGALTVAVDWVMEPVAIRLDYWSWEGGLIPLQNYLAWFLIAAAASLVFRLLGLKLKSWILPIYAGIQLLFFAILRIFL